MKFLNLLFDISFSGISKTIYTADELLTNS